ALEQLDLKLVLEIGDRIADDGLRALQPARGCRETAAVSDCREDGQLVKRRVRFHLFPRSEQPTFSLFLGWMSSAIFCFQGRRYRAAEICEGANNMSSILVVTSSPRAGASISTRLATNLAERLAASRPGAKIAYRDLVEAPLPHVDGDFLGGLFSSPDE